MLLMLEDGVRGEITQVINKFSYAKNKYINDYDKNEDSSSVDVNYLDVIRLYVWAMCQKPPVKNFNYCKDLKDINQKFIKKYDEDSSEKGYILEVDVEFPKKLLDEHSDLPFLPDKFKIYKTYKTYM